MKTLRIGQIVPSSNITMETEIPAMLNAHAARHGLAYTFHSSRMRMHKVTREELVAMNKEGLRCIAELADAEVDIASTACLVAHIAVGERDPMLLLDDLKRLDTSGVDAVVLSVCVQMPSLPAIHEAQKRLGMPVVSTAVCTVRSMLDRLGLAPDVPGAGVLLGDRI